MRNLYLTFGLSKNVTKLDKLIHDKTRNFAFFRPSIINSLREFYFRGEE